MSYPPREGSRETRQGLIISKYPDVCRSPHACVPYTIIAYQSDAAGTAATVRATGQRAHKQNSVVTKCFGDEPGVGLGVKSNTVGSVCHRKTHSHNVRIEGQWATRDTDEWYMNNRNTRGKLAWYSGSPAFTPTPPLQQAPAAGPVSQSGEVMSDATPFTYEPGKQYALLNTGTTTGGGQLRFAPTPQTADPKPQSPTPQPAQTKPTPPTETPPPQSRWWRILSGGNFLLKLQMALTGVAVDRLAGMPQRLEEAHQKDLEAQGMTGSAIESNLDRQFKNTAFGRWYPGSFKDYAREVSADPNAEARLQRQWQEETERNKNKTGEVDTTAPNPVGRTPDNFSIKGQRQKRECRCITGAYDDIKTVCGVACGKDYQAHHIVPDYTLRYGTRAEAEKGQKRIPGLPTFGKGPSICLKGYAADKGSEHGLAHQADAKVAALGSGWSTPEGTADISSIRDISRDEAVKATAGECRKEIDAALNAQPSLRSNILGRTTIMPPEEGTKPYELLSSGARATVH